MVFAIAMFVWEKLPLAVTAMIIPMALHVFGVLTPAQSFAGFVNASVILFASMFVVAGAFHETGVAAIWGRAILKLAKTERQLLILSMLMVGLVGSVMSNTAAAAIFLPIIIGICTASGFSRSRLLLPMAYGATMSGSLTLISSPGNLIAHSLLQEQGYAGYAFFDLGFVGFPVLFIGCIFYGLVGQKLIPDYKLADSEVKEKDYSSVPQWKRTVSVLTLIVVVLCMIFVDQIGIANHVVSTIGAIFLVVVGVMKEKEAYASISWPVIFLFAGTLPLATALETTGAGRMFAEWALGLLGENPTPFAATAMVFFTAVALTTLISNTATTALLAPISISIAHAMDADPMAAAAATVVGAAMSFATPISTPPNTIVFAHGGYKFTDYVKAGIPLTIVTSIASVILLPIVFPFW